MTPALSEPPIASPHTISAVGLSTLAQRILAAAGQAGVAAVFPSAAYLSHKDGRVVAVTGESVDLGPLSVVVRGEPRLDRRLTPGEPVTLAADRVRTASLIISLSGAASWDPRPNWPEVRSELSAKESAGAALRELVLRHAPPDSLASLLETEGTAAKPGAAGDLVAAARRASGKLLDVLAEPASDSAQLEAAAASLAGLGGGFTPAGDDFLMGVMFAARAALAEPAAHRLSHTLARSAAPRTTTVSAAYLRAAAGGAAGQAWHRLLQALKSSDLPAQGTSVAELCRIGHTSGADALAGFVLALDRLVASQLAHRQSPGSQVRQRLLPVKGAGLGWG